MRPVMTLMRLQRQFEKKGRYRSTLEQGILAQAAKVSTPGAPAAAVAAFVVR